MQPRTSIGEMARRQRPTAVRRRARRRARRLRLLGAAALVLALAAWPAARWLLTSPVFAVDRVEAGPYRFTDPATLEPLLDAALGCSLWSGAPGRLAARLEALPWVREARVVRRIPSRLRVELREWRPLLAVAPPAGAGGDGPERLLLLEDGSLAPPPADLPSPALPVLVGAAPERGADGWSLGGTGAAVLDLMAAVAETGLEASAPVDYVVASERGLSLVLQDGGRRLIVGRQDFAARLRLYLATRDQLAEGETVDLRFRGRVTVRGAGAGGWRS